MSVINVVTLLGGLALFLYGMTIMGSGLEKISGGKLERILEKLTSKVIYGVLIGAVVTGVIQSSSATSVMVVGFVNAGIMSLSQAVGVIMGANIGTTVTAQILRMGDISSDMLLLNLLKPTSLASIVAAVGIVLFMFVRKGKRHDFGQILLGFGILFFGMSVMESAVAPLKDSPAFVKLFTMFSNPLLGILVGTLVTAVIQSSSASVGILQALSSTGVIPFSAAVPIIMGQNIGTTITALISSIGASRNAKRAALIHTYFNVIGTAFFVVVIYSIKSLLPFWDDNVDRGMIANFHTVFNIGSVVIIYPFTKLLIKLAEKSIPNSPNDEPQIEILDPRFLNSPSLALDKARDTVVQIAALVQKNLSRASVLIHNYDEQKMARLKDTEDVIDRAEVRLEQYLVALTDRDLTLKESAIQSELLHSINDFERIADHAINVAESASQFSKEMPSASAAAELEAMFGAVKSILDATVALYTNRDVEAAYRIEPFEQVIDRMNDVIRRKHVERLKRGECTAELGAAFIEILVNLERIADHCANLAVSVIATYGHPFGDEFDRHEFIHKMHHSNAFEYNKNYAEFEDKYLTPLRSM